MTVLSKNVIWPSGLRISLRLALALFVSCLIAVTVSAQGMKLRTIENGLEYEKCPIELISRGVGPLKFNAQNQGLASSDWLKDIRLEVKNISEKTIASFSIEVIIPKYANMQVPFAISLDYPDAAIVNTKTGVLKPGEIVTVGVTNAQGTFWTRELAKYGVTQLPQVNLEILQVIYDDDTGWQKGLDVVRDPSTPLKIYKPVAKKRSGY